MQAAALDSKQWPYPSDSSMFRGPRVSCPSHDPIALAPLMSPAKAWPGGLWMLGISWVFLRARTYSQDMRTYVFWCLGVQKSRPRKISKVWMCEKFGSSSERQANSVPSDESQKLQRKRERERDYAPLTTSLSWTLLGTVGVFIGWSSGSKRQLRGDVSSVLKKLLILVLPSPGIMQAYCICMLIYILSISILIGFEHVWRASLTPGHIMKIAGSSSFFNKFGFMQIASAVSETPGECLTSMPWGSPLNWPRPCASPIWIRGLLGWYLLIFWGGIISWRLVWYDIIDIIVSKPCLLIPFIYCWIHVVS